MLTNPITIKFSLRFPEETFTRKATINGVDPTTTVRELGERISIFVDTFWPRPPGVLAKYDVFAFGVFKNDKFVGQFTLTGTVAESMIGRYGLDPLVLRVYGKYVSTRDPSLFPTEQSRKDATPPQLPFPDDGGGDFQYDDKFYTPSEDDDDDAVYLNPTVTPFRLYDDAVSKGKSAVRRFDDSLGGEGLPYDDDDDDDDVQEGKRPKLKCKMCQAKIGVFICKSCKDAVYCGAVCYSKDKDDHKSKCKRDQK